MKMIDCPPCTMPIGGLPFGPFRRGAPDPSDQVAYAYGASHGNACTNIANSPVGCDCCCDCPIDVAVAYNPSPGDLQAVPLCIPI
jgi:hypothetical protein